LPIKPERLVVQTNYQLSIAKLTAQMIVVSRIPEHGLEFLPRVEKSPLISPIPLVDFTITYTA
jgi:hypothetical protein